VKRSIRDLGDGYPPDEVPPATPAELRAMERRSILEPHDVGRRVPGPPAFHKGAAPATMRAVGLYDGDDWLTRMPLDELDAMICDLAALLVRGGMTPLREKNVRLLLDCCREEATTRMEKKP
jgi:hypothetical protein